MSYIAKLDKNTQDHLEAIFKYSYNKWFDGKISKKPTKSDIVRTLINGLYDLMVKEGDIVE